MLKQLTKYLARQAARATGILDQLDGQDAKLKALNDRLTQLDDRTREVGREAARVDRGTQIALALRYRDLWARGERCAFDDVEFRSFSQNGEDGILWYIFSLIGATNKTCVEICVEDGSQCNTTNLIINHGWNGMLFDGSEENVNRGRAFFASHPDTLISPPKFVHAWITKENIDSLITDNGFKGEIDLLSLDLDGVDYWIWDAIKAISPRVVIAEVQAVWGAERSVTVPYRPDFQTEFIQGFGVYSGASLPAFVKLARSKGYRLVGCQRYGFNAVFMRDNVGRDAFLEIEASECFHHPFAKWAYDELRPLVADKEWVAV